MIQLLYQLATITRKNQLKPALKVLSFFVFLLSVCTLPVQAQPRTLNGGDWSNALNWTGGIPDGLTPGQWVLIPASSTSRLDNLAPATSTGSGTNKLDSIIVEQDATLYIEGGVAALRVACIRIKSGGRIILDGGVVTGNKFINTDSVFVEQDASGTGRLLVSNGTGVNYTLRIGFSGPGKFLVLPGPGASATSAGYVNLANDAPYTSLCQVQVINGPTTIGGGTEMIFGTLSINNGTTTLVGNVAVRGNVTVGFAPAVLEAGTATGGSYDLTVSGNLTINNVFIPRTGRILMDGNASSSDINYGGAGNLVMYTLVIKKKEGTKVGITNPATKIVLNNDLIIQSGYLDLSTQNTADTCLVVSRDLSIAPTGGLKIDKNDLKVAVGRNLYDYNTGLPTPTQGLYFGDVAAGQNAFNATACDNCYPSTPGGTVGFTTVGTNVFPDYRSVVYNPEIIFYGGPTGANDQTFEGSANIPSPNMIGLIGLNLPHVKVIGNKNRKVVMGTPCRIRGDLRIEGGEFILNGKRWIFGDWDGTKVAGSDLDEIIISNNGIFYADPGSATHMFTASCYGTRIACNAGGTLKMVGALIGRESLVGQYFRIYVSGIGARVSAYNTTFFQMSGNGLTVEGATGNPATGVVIDNYPYNFSGCHWFGGSCGPSNGPAGCHGFLRFLNHSQPLTGANSIKNLSVALQYATPTMASGGNFASILVTTGTVNGTTGVNRTTYAGPVLVEIRDALGSDDMHRSEWEENDNNGNTIGLAATTGTIRWFTSGNVYYWRGNTSDNWFVNTNWVLPGNITPATPPTDTDYVEVYPVSTNLAANGCTGCGTSSATNLPEIKATPAGDTAKCYFLKLFGNTGANILNMQASGAGTRAKLRVIKDVYLNNNFRPRDGKIWVGGTWNILGNPNRFGPGGGGADRVGSEVVFDGKGGQSVLGGDGSGPYYFFHFTVEKDSGFLLTRQTRPWGVAALIINGDVTLNKGAWSIQTDQGSIRVNGNWRNNGAVFIPAIKEVEFIMPDTAVANNSIRTIYARPNAAYPVQAFNKVKFGKETQSSGNVAHFLLQTDVSIIDTSNIGVRAEVIVNRFNAYNLGDGYTPDFHVVEGTLSISKALADFPAAIQPKLTAAGYEGEGGRLVMSPNNQLRLIRGGRLNLLGTNPHLCMLTRPYNSGYYRILAQKGSIVSAKYVKADFIKSFQMGRVEFSTYGEVVNGSNIMRNVTRTDGLFVGQLISGTGVPANTVVTAITSNTITMSANATATTSGSYTFLNQFTATGGTATLTGLVPSVAQLGLEVGMYVTRMSGGVAVAQDTITAVDVSGNTITLTSAVPGGSHTFKFNGYAYLDDDNPFNNSVFSNGQPGSTVAPNLWKEAYLYLPIRSNKIGVPLWPDEEKWDIQDLAFIQTKTNGYNIQYDAIDSTNFNVTVNNSFGQFSGPGVAPGTMASNVYEFENVMGSPGNVPVYDVSNPQSQINNRFRGTIKWYDDPVPYRWRGGDIASGGKTGDSLWINAANWFTVDCNTPAATPPSATDVVLLDHTCVTHPYTVVVPAMGDNENRRANCVRLRVNSNIGNSTTPIRLLLSANDQGFQSWPGLNIDAGLITDGTPAYIGSGATYPDFGTLPNYEASAGANFTYDGGNIKIWGNTTGSTAATNITAVLSMESLRDTVILLRQSQVEINVGGFYVPRQGCYQTDTLSHTLFKGYGSSITSSGNEFGDVSINAEGGFTLEDAMYQKGRNFRIDRGVFDVGPANNLLTIWGSWTNNSNNAYSYKSRFNPRNGAVRLEGFRRQRITRNTTVHSAMPIGIPSDSLAYERFWNLYIDKSGDTLNVDSLLVDMNDNTDKIYIAKGLFLSKGILRTNTTSHNTNPYPRRVIIDPLGVAAWANTNGYVEGKLSYVFDNWLVTKSKTYEVGKGKDYAPFELSIRMTRADSVEFIGEAFKANPTTLGPGLNDNPPYNSAFTTPLNPDPTSVPLVPGFCDINSPGWSGPTLPTMTEKLSRLVGNHYWRLTRSKTLVNVLAGSVGASTGAGTGFAEGKVKMYWQTNDSMACPTYPNATVCCGGGNVPTFLNFLRVAHIRADASGWDNQGAANATGGIAAGQIENSVIFKDDGSLMTPHPAPSSPWLSNLAILKTAAADAGAGYFAFANVDIPLPVERLRFNAEYVNGQTLLKWETMNERSNAGFILSRSVDAPVGFEPFANYRENRELVGQGTRAGVFNYNYVDPRSLEVGKTYYFRLESVDFNGTITNTEIREIRIPYGFGFTNVYPNPTNTTTNVRFTLGESGSTSLTIFDAAGRAVQTVVSRDLAAGIYSMDIDTRSLGAGVYMLVLKTAQGTDQRKLVVE